MSRVDIYKKKRILPWGLKKHKNDLIENGGAKQVSIDTNSSLAENDKLNFKYSIITILVVSSLVYILKLLSGLEKQLFLDSQYDFISRWNFILHFGEAMFISAFIPVGVFIINFVFYFVPNSTITTRKLEIAYSRVIFYLMYCILCVLIIIPVIVINTSKNLQVYSILFYSSLIATVPIIIIKKVTRESFLHRGYIKYLVVGYIILIIFSLKSFYYDYFPSLRLEKGIYYSSVDKTALATFNGNASGGFLCPLYQCDKDTSNGILLDRFDEDTSKTTFIINLTDPRITSGTYEVIVHYYNSIQFSDQKQTNNDKKLSRKLQYVFDGETADERKQYFMKFIYRIIWNNSRDNPNYHKIITALNDFSSLIEKNNFYISNEIAKNEAKVISNMLPEQSKKIFHDLIRDTVYL
ncbi:hypothetical protein [Cohnella sp. GCM10027633]|uniref:hypothetical protein n=1 Tax=unclassified Cohnella TaxID=2636738 RepID=UPI0036252D6F